MGNTNTLKTILNKKMHIKYDPNLFTFFTERTIVKRKNYHTFTPCKHRYIH